MLEPHETTAARLPQPRTYLKPYAPVPSLSGASMSPRAWNLSESRELPLSAPELIKPNPNQERTTTSRYDIDAELIDPEKIIPAPAPPGGVTFAPGSIAPASSAQALAPAPPPSKAAAADGGDPSKVVVEVPQPPPLTAVEQALASGHLSGARVCQMLLQGEMSAASFGRALAAMPMEYLPFWLDGFGRCVALLGETIAQLKKQIDVQLKRNNKQALALVVRQARAKLAEARADLLAARADVTRDLAEARADIEGLVSKGGEELARRSRVAVNWKRLALAGLLQPRRRHTRLLRLISHLDDLATLTTRGPSPLGDLRSVAHEVCTAAQQMAGGCLEATLYVLDARPTLQPATTTAPGGGSGRGDGDSAPAMYR